MKHQFPRSLLWFLQHIPQNHSQFQIMCMIVHRLGWGQHANVRLACEMQLCMYQMSLECFSVFLSGQGQQIIPDAVMS